MLSAIITIARLVGTERMPRSHATGSTRAGLDQGSAPGLGRSARYAQGVHQRTVRGFYIRFIFDPTYQFTIHITGCRRAPSLKYRTFTFDDFRVLLYENCLATFDVQGDCPNWPCTMYRRAWMSKYSYGRCGTVQYCTSTCLLLRQSNTIHP